ncbi:alpha/beta fold hydrolase [Nocardia sp. NBC_01388]|uniref:alpha/beta fold hydrolase n=1 Tax=Nocardia sp. NBC_01388 TaxID=2903596 RepID=UPI00324AAB64
MTDIDYFRTGQGEPLVLLHGVGSRRQVWDPIITDLARHFDVIAVDMPGYGNSPGTDSSVEALTEQVSDLILALGIHPHVAGNSLGGTIALQLAARGQARSVTAFSPTGFWSTPGSLWFQLAVRGIRLLGRAIRPALPALLRNTVTRTMLFGLFVGKAWALDPSVALDDALGVLNSPGLDTSMSSLHRFRHRGPGPGVPITIAWGSRDGLLTRPTQSRKARRTLPRAQHLILAGCGHIPFYDDPSTCAAVIISRRFPS